MKRGGGYIGRIQMIYIFFSLNGGGRVCFCVQFYSLREDQASGPQKNR
jgi:hypothetical protein